MTQSYRPLGGEEMSDKGFDDLFRGYPRTGARVEDLRARVRIAITDSLVKLRSGLADVKKLKPSQYMDLTPTFRVIEGYDLWKIRDLPAGVEKRLMALREPYQRASDTYHAAAEQRQGLARRKVGATPELLEAFRVGLQQTLEDIIKWCEEIQPDEDK